MKSSEVAKNFWKRYIFTRRGRNTTSILGC